MNNLILISIIAFNIIFAVFIFKIVIPFLSYISSDYSALSDKSYYKVKADKGLNGEYLIFRKLEKLNFYKQMIINAYVTKDDKNDTEIDIIMICSKGIFVFESKNYSGLIVGKESDFKLKQILGKRVNYLYNPIMQNRNHIKWLAHYLKGLNSNLFHSIIVFGDKSDTSKLVFLSSDYIKTQTSRLAQDINFEKYKDSLTFQQINDIYNILLSNVFVNEKVKQRHIDYVKKIQEKNNKK